MLICVCKIYRNSYILQEIRSINLLTRDIFLSITPHCCNTYIDVAYRCRRSSVTCRSVTVVSPANTAKPIEMPFGLRTGPSNDVLDGGPDTNGNGQFWGGGMGQPTVKHMDTQSWAVQKRLNCLDPFGSWTRVGPRKHVLGRVNRPCAAAIATKFCK